MGWGREGEGSGLGGQGGCDRRIEKFLGKFKKRKFQGGLGSVWGAVRVDVTEELKFLCKFKKKKKWGEGGGQGNGVGGGGGSGWMRTKN